MRRIPFQAKSKLRSVAFPAAVALALAGIILLFFNRLASGNLILARGDTYLYFYPYWRAAAEALREGRVPLWNSSLFMGAPFMANSQVGFFYPLNWPLWLSLATPYALSASIILHLLIAGCGVYLLGRTGLSLSRPAAVLAALLFSLGGYLTAQVEHINQVQGIAWLPWYFVALYLWTPGNGSRKLSLKLTASIAAILSLQLLSGHTQTVFISLTAVAAWLTVTYLSFRDKSIAGDSIPGRIAGEIRFLWSFLKPVALGIVLAIGISAVQLLPTLELSRQSIRQGGLPPNEVLSFSMQPLLLGQSLLPSYEKIIYSEYVAFIPIMALLLAAIGARRAWRTKQARPFLLLIALGLGLAIGRFDLIYTLLARLPGFNLFRAPARWSVLYALAIALIAASGWESIYRTSVAGQAQGEQKKDIKALAVGALAVVCLAVLSFMSNKLASVVPLAPETTADSPSAITLVAWLVELISVIVLYLLATRGQLRIAAVWSLWIGIVAVLFLSSRILPYNHPTTSGAYFEQRAPESYLLANAGCQAPDWSCMTGSRRVLGLSDILFDLGDKAELDGIYADRLGDRELFDYVVASKQKEVLGPNLPLEYGLQSVDGFDGGVLPLKRYSMLMSLILPEGEQTLDGRLREQLDTIPEERWLDQFGTRYIITDKVGDQWRQGVFFDMKHPVTITAGTGPAHVGYLPRFEATDLYLISEGTPGKVDAIAEGREQWLLAAQEVDPDLWKVHFPRPASLQFLGLNPCNNDTSPELCTDGWNIKSLALVDDRDNSFMPLVLGDYRLVFSGDVKIYENLDTEPMATLYYDWTFTPNLQESLSLMGTEGFDPETMAAVEGTSPRSAGTGSGQVSVESYSQESLALSTDSDQQALLLLREAYFPGWQARIDGAPADLVQTDVLFRGVFVPAGAHSVVLEYRPVSYRIGAVITVVCLAGWLLVIVYGAILPLIGRSNRPGPGGPTGPTLC